MAAVRVHVLHCRLTLEVESVVGVSSVGVTKHTESSPCVLVMVRAIQVAKDSARNFSNASASCRPHGHSLWMCKVTVRPVVVIRPAACKST